MKKTKRNLLLIIVLSVVIVFVGIVVHLPFQKNDPNNSDTTYTYYLDKVSTHKDRSELKQIHLQDTLETVLCEIEQITNCMVAFSDFANPDFMTAEVYIQLRTDSQLDEKTQLGIKKQLTSSIANLDEKDITLIIFHNNSQG